MHKLNSSENPLGPRVKAVIEYIFEHPDHNQTRIAKAMGLSTSRISAILRNDRALAAMPLIARRRVKGMVPRAIKRFDQLMRQGANLEVARKVSESVLNSEKVLENQPAIQINVLQSMTNDDLERKIGVSRTLPGQSLEGELA